MLDVSPPKLSVVNLHTLDTLTAQFNPAEFSETVGANYSSEVVPGYSQPVRQFVHTEPDVLELSLYFECFQGGPIQYEANLRARRFLMAACYPRKLAGAMQSAGAPRLLLLWPGLIAMTVTLDKVKFGYTSFNQDSGLTTYTAACTFTEIRDSLLTCEDVLAKGTERAGL